MKRITYGLCVILFLASPALASPWLDGPVAKRSASCDCDVCDCPVCRCGKAKHGIQETSGKADTPQASTKAKASTKGRMSEPFPEGGFWIEPNPPDHPPVPAGWTLRTVDGVHYLTQDGQSNAKAKTGGGCVKCGPACECGPNCQCGADYWKDYCKAIPPEHKAAYMRYLSARSVPAASPFTQGMIAPYVDNRSTSYPGFYQPANMSTFALPGIGGGTSAGCSSGG